MMAAVSWRGKFTDLYFIRLPGVFVLGMVLHMPGRSPFPGFQSANTTLAEPLFIEMLWERREQFLIFMHVLLHPATLKGVR
jgi:hypothetical protein